MHHRAPAQLLRTSTPALASLTRRNRLLRCLTGSAAYVFLQKNCSAVMVSESPTSARQAAVAPGPTAEGVRAVAAAMVP
jgi:hypothetical protein